MLRLFSTTLDKTFIDVDKFLLMWKNISPHKWMNGKWMDFLDECYLLENFGQLG
jgi:hypothetical protein